MRDHDRHDERADRRRGASQPKPAAPTCSTSLAYIGQQIGRAAEQHDEQVERDRAEDDLILEDESNASNQARESRSFLRALWRANAKHR